jgi:hypothetical protein
LIRCSSCLRTGRRCHPWRITHSRTERTTPRSFAAGAVRSSSPGVAETVRNPDKHPLQGCVPRRTRSRSSNSPSQHQHLGADGTDVSSATVTPPPSACPGWFGYQPDVTPGP